MSEPRSPEPAIGFAPRLRKSPYFDATRRWGAKAYTVYNHTYMPLYYEDPVADYRALAERVTLWDVACQRQVVIAGPDALALAQRLTPRNLTHCAPGQCRYAPVTAGDGGLLNDPLLLHVAADELWLSIADSDLGLWVRAIALGSGLRVTVSEPDIAPLQLQGPNAPPMMAQLGGEALATLGYFRCRRVELGGIPVLVSRSGWSGEPGYEIYLPDPTRGDALWEMLMAAGAPFGIAPAAPSQISRVEAGLISYGADASPAENPLELGLERFVDLDMQAEFIGKTALRRIRAQGVRRRRVGLELGGPPLVSPNEEPWALTVADAPVGRLTSAVHSLRLGRNIAMGIVAVAHARPGSALRVHAPGRVLDAAVTGLPHLRPRR